MTSEFDTRKSSIIIGESPKGGKSNVVIGESPKGKSKPIVVKIVSGSHQGK